MIDNHYCYYWGSDLIEGKLLVSPIRSFIIVYLTRFVILNDELKLLTDS